MNPWTVIGITGALAAASVAGRRGSRGSHPKRQRLYHGGPDWVHHPRPGTFFSSSVEGVLAYARYGPDQRRRTPQDGVISVFALDPTAKVERFNSFGDAYKAYRTSSTQGLARMARMRQRADVVQVYDEHIVANPAVLTYLGFNLVSPQAGRVRGQRVGAELRKLSRRFIDDSNRVECQWDINTGLCEDWAEAARELLGGGETYWFANLLSEMLEAEGIEGVHELGGGELWHPISHAVLSYEGRWYDSQHPDGVDVLSDLDLVREVERQDFLASRGGSLARTVQTRKMRSRVNQGSDGARVQQVPWAPFAQRWGAAGGVPVGSRLPLDEIFSYWSAMTNMSPDDAAAYFELFRGKPTWELRMVDPWVIESYSEPGRIQSDAGLDEEHWAVKYAERGTATAPPVVLFEYEGDDPRYAFLTSDGTHRARAALLEGRWIQAWVPASSPMAGSTVGSR